MELVLVTGGAGFIGSHTVDRLLSMGYGVRILDNLQKPVHLKGKPDYIPDEAEFILGDIRDKETVRKALKGVDYVFHLAAYQDYLPDFSTFFHVNSVGTALIYEIAVAENLKIKKIIVASSQFVNGEGIYKSADGKYYYPKRRSNEQLEKGIWDFLDENGKPLQWQWTPETYASPPNQYAMSKYSQELMALNFGERYNIPSVALRYSIVQGSRQSFYNMYSGACRIFSLSYFFDKPPVIYEDGNMMRDFVNVHDVVDANILMMQDDRADYQAFCVGGGKDYSVKEFANIVAKEFGKEDIKPLINGEYRFGDTRNACSDISKIKTLGWAPKRDAYDSVKEYVNYLKSQTDIDDILEYSQKTMKNLNVVRKAASK
ncbi:MAG: NAD-dependent epimerase/dehydratase family protein [Ignavibacteriae bacterium]|nr:MAG: NAD-dependent epimerase/dehydratase family protein [Ignavibacteriota bacterium]